MRNIKLTIILLLAFTLCSAQWSKYGKWHDWLTKQTLLIPKTGLALLVNPGAQMIEYAQGNKKYPGLQYGANVYSEPTQTMTNGSLYLFEFTADITNGTVSLSNSSISGSVSIISGNNSFYVKANSTSGTWTWSTTATISNKSFKEITNVNGLSSATVQDYSGNNNDGTAQGGLETEQPVHPYAWEFDGVNDYADFGDVVNVGANDFITWAWIKTTSTSGNFRIFCKRVTYYGFEMAMFSNGNDNFFFGDGTNYAYGSISGTGSLNDGDWHLYCLVFKHGDKVISYVDGVLLGSSDISFIGNSDNTGNFKIGLDVNNILFYTGNIGLSGIYIFDGKDGRPSSLPSNYETAIIKKIYNNTKRYYQ